jgi:hypothetical protein
VLITVSFGSIGTLAGPIGPVIRQAADKRNRRDPLPMIDKT